VHAASLRARPWAVRANMRRALKQRRQQASADCKEKRHNTCHFPCQPNTQNSRENSDVQRQRTLRLAQECAVEAWVRAQTKPAAPRESLPRRGAAGQVPMVLLWLVDGRLGQGSLPEDARTAVATATGGMTLTDAKGGVGSTAGAGAAARAQENKAKWTHSKRCVPANAASSPQSSSSSWAALMTATLAGAHACGTSGTGAGAGAEAGAAGECKQADRSPSVRLLPSDKANHTQAVTYTRMRGHRPSRHRPGPSPCPLCWLHASPRQPARQWRRSKQAGLVTARGALASARPRAGVLLHAMRTGQARKSQSRAKAFCATPPHELV
jgi:hypothetical protein